MSNPTTGDRKDSYEYHGHRVEIYFFKGAWTIYIDGRDTGEASSGDIHSQVALANLTIDQMEEA